MSEKPEDDPGIQPELSRASVPDSMSMRNLEPDREAACLPTVPENHDDKEFAREPNSPKTDKRSNTNERHGELAGYPDLRERFAAIEKKIDVVDVLFGLQYVDQSAAGNDSDSSSDTEPPSIAPYYFKFVRETTHLIRATRISFENQQRSLLLEKAQKRARRAAKQNRDDSLDQESARQISTAAFLKGEPATVMWLDWEHFLARTRELEACIMTPIAALTGEPEPQVILGLRTRLDSAELSTKPSSNRPANKMINTEDPAGQGPLPERVKILSHALVAIFALHIAKDSPPSFTEDGFMVLLRPFKPLIFYEKRLREFLVDLETHFENFDGANGKPSPLPGTDGADAALGSTTEEDKGSKRTAPGPNFTWIGDYRRVEYLQASSISITALLHLRCLMKFIDDEIKPKLEYVNSDKCRKIFFHDLWHLFKPGNEIVDQEEKQAYRIIRVQIPPHNIELPWLRYKKPATGPKTPATIHCAYIDFDGKQFGPVSVNFDIPPFGGLKDVKSLPIYPLRFAKDSQLRQNLIKRGKMLLEVTKFKPMYYMGFALDTGDEIDSPVVVDFTEALADENRREGAPKIESIRTASDKNGQHVYEGFCCLRQPVWSDAHFDSFLTDDLVKRLLPDTPFGAPSLILSPRPLEETQAGSEDEPTDEEFVVMTYRVLGFVLRSRKWAQLDLTFLRNEITDARNSTLSAFERLELPHGHREMVKSLVTQHFRDRRSACAGDGQTDLIKGKGKGLILLLHGAPGVGKTTTAEGVAELFQKPLFQITCGDLGTTARDVENELEKNFALASRWGCILLLDEADVFLSARELHDFKRNGLVAVFLRVLEYYAGVLFLTTNRIGDFDEAFSSRIHMSLYYPELDELKTKKVFKLNLGLIQERFDRQNRKITYDASSIEHFAEQHFREHKYSRWNGRQIRNACQTALALAEFDAHGGDTRHEVNRDVVVELQLKHFSLVQAACLEFGRYLGDIRGTQGDQRAVNNQFRARTDMPRHLSASVDESSPGAKDGRHSGSLSGPHYPGQGDSYQPLMNAGYPCGPTSNMASVYIQHPQQGQPIRLMGNGGNRVYETQQGSSHPGSQQVQMDPRPYHHQEPQMGFNQQGQGWGNPNSGMTYHPAGQPLQGQPLQGQPLQEQAQYVYGSMQHGISTQSHATATADPSMQPSHFGGLGGRSGMGGGPEAGGSTS
ncbi:hypothetical protein QQX98_001033 [Neonectria punicea]|uniref:AAA+ ATPase domain-containing protein n=1 Tax=Neonectria punicea TaxID=979145 RepID=A0ABR1HRT4_9HYPO